MIVDAHPRDLIIALDPATTEHSGVDPSQFLFLCLSVRGTAWWWRELTHRARKAVMPRCRACSPRALRCLSRTAGACALLSACRLPLWVFFLGPETLRTREQSDFSTRTLVVAVAFRPRVDFFNNGSPLAGGHPSADAGSLLSRRPLICAQRGVSRTLRNATQRNCID